MRVITHRAGPVMLQLLFAPSLLLGQCRATLSGKVIDEMGSPLALASVQLVEYESSARYRILGPFETDATGKFQGTVDVSGRGLYFLSVKKEEAGYPNSILSFYINQLPQEFRLSCESSQSGIVLKVGPKAANIQHISVLDADSAKPIADASIKLWRLTSPLRKLHQSELGITTSTRLAPPATKYSGLVVPSNVEIAFQISAPGYLTSRVARIRLKPLEDFDITVKLRPVPGKGP